MPNTLSEITVVDLTQNIAGPYCTQLLGDFGASVLKIERPGAGDDSRRWAPRTGVMNQPRFSPSIETRKVSVLM
jgi:crotonobetainyl-CoA:carnitine CoA-transferase CaiB-like acyl-CoA transferase